MVYRPWSLVAPFTTIPVAADFTETTAPWITAPEGSLTRPVRDAVCAKHTTDVNVITNINFIDSSLSSSPREVKRS
jgi:hypothetical protein